MCSPDPTAAGLARPAPAG